MKKQFIGLFFFAAMAAQAQTNLQVHYDFGEDRKYVTSTLEMFKPDKWGNTFFFVDIDYNNGKDNHPSLAYMEIARCLKFWDGPISAQVEYNGGLGGNSFPATSNYSYVINNSWLFGADYSFHNADFTQTLNLKALYKEIVGKQSSVQFTGVWGLQLLDKKVTFSGFADVWKEDNSFSNGKSTDWIFISEPQIWYNFTENFSAGSEIELSNNFGTIYGFMVNPTLAVKWNF